MSRTVIAPTSDRLSGEPFVTRNISACVTSSKMPSSLSFRPTKYRLLVDVFHCRQPQRFDLCEERVGGNLVVRRCLVDVLSHHRARGADSQAEAHKQLWGPRGPAARESCADGTGIEPRQAVPSRIVVVVVARRQ